MIDDLQFWPPGLPSLAAMLLGFLFLALWRGMETIHRHEDSRSRKRMADERELLSRVEQSHAEALPSEGHDVDSAESRPRPAEPGLPPRL